jgi:mRNA interferase MazF
MAVERWEIWSANLEPVVGSEQGKARPVLILSSTALNRILPVVNVLPMTSRKPHRRVYPNEALIPVNVAGLTSESIVLCYQIRTLDKQRLTKKFGQLEDENLRNQILEALKFQLEID